MALSRTRKYTLSTAPHTGALLSACFRKMKVQPAGLAPCAWPEHQNHCRLPQARQPIFYNDYADETGTRQADFVAEGKVLVELKAITELTDVHLAMLLSCLNTYRFEAGLLINFGGKRVVCKRVVLSRTNICNKI